MAFQSVQCKYPIPFSLTCPKTRYQHHDSQNNRNFADSPGERSSQYAAESSCRLRFGDHTDWIGQLDIDEYLSPQGDFDSLPPLLDKLDQEGNKIVSFGSWRAWPRKNLIEYVLPLAFADPCLLHSHSLAKESCHD